jgi:Lrp/AsnC family transcriptional regulator for asnA, asnC and gidA
MFLTGPYLGMKLDEINLAIITMMRDGRISYSQIAKKLSVSENTVRNRAGKLVEDGVMEISGVVDPEALPGHRLVIIGVNLKTMDLVHKAKELSDLKGVVSVCVVTGRYDLMITVLLKEGFGLLEFYTEELARIQDVQSVETFVVYKGYNLKVPYVL